MLLKDSNLNIQVFIIIFLILIYPSLALSNAGTPLLWAGTLQVYFVNILIALFESMLIKRKFNNFRTFLVILIIIFVANYASMFSGWGITSFVTNQIGSDFFSPQGNEYLIQNIILYISLTITSVLVEFPFYWFLFKDENLDKVFKITFNINIISATVIIFYYTVFQLIMYSNIL